MKTYKRLVITLISLFLISIICGCGGTSKPVIPDSITDIPEGKARIVLTRPSKFALIPPYLIVDIGSGMQSNGIIALRNRVMRHSISYSSEKEYRNYFFNLDHRNTNINISGVEFLWFNPKKADYIFCGGEDRACKSVKEEYPYGFVTGGINLFWGTGAAYYQATLKRKLSLLEINNGVRKEGRILGQPELLSNVKYDKVIWPETDIHKSLNSLFNPALFVSLMEQVRNNNLDSVFLKGYFSGKTPSFKKLPDKLIRSFALDNSKTTMTLSNNNVLIDNRLVSRNVQAIGVMEFGDTLIWDRTPGEIHLIAIGGAPANSHTIMPEAVKIEAGKTYYVDFSIRLGKGAFWELLKVE